MFAHLFDTEPHNQSLLALMDPWMTRHITQDRGSYAGLRCPSKELRLISILLRDDKLSVTFWSYCCGTRARSAYGPRDVLFMDRPGLSCLDYLAQDCAYPSVIQIYHSSFLFTWYGNHYCLKAISHTNLTSRFCFFMYLIIALVFAYDRPSQGGSTNSSCL